MATGDLTVFEEFSLDIGDEDHDLAADTIRLGIIDNTAAPTAADATPTWGDYSANQVATGGNYSGPVTLTTTYTEAAGVATLTAQSFTISQDASNFTDGYWAVVYNDSAAADEAICFIELGGPVDGSAGDVTIRFNNAAVGVAGNVLTVTVS